MPIYDYICKTCGLEFEELNSISNREKPTLESPYSGCTQVEAQCEIILKPVAPVLGDSVKLGIRKPDDAFKDKLKDIKRKHRGSTINV